jgi:hypothetical protein
MSINPLQPVLEFQDSAHAQNFHKTCLTTTRFVKEKSSRWLFVDEPHGLIRVYTAKDGRFAFEFGSQAHANAFNNSIHRIGHYIHNTDYHMHRIYVGKA